jgi:endonuclease/exonuclease/phosphatase family metal-dependent hydrolase
MISAPIAKSADMLARMPLRELSRGLVLASIAAVLAVPAIADAKAKPKPKPAPVSVMTRNVYLGADLTPGVQAADFQGLVNAAGVILNQVDDNDFAIRAKGLAAEIKAKKPDLVGLQEAALWRTAACTENPLPPKATTVRYDYVALLMRELNKGAKRYRVVISQPEFDFEVYANTDGNESTAGPGCSFGSEINGRLTMRDAILARVGGKSKVRTAKAKAGHFDTLLQVRPAGVQVNVTRGWTAVDASVGKSRKFHFVNTHLEAYSADTRLDQAKELTKRALKTKRPTVLVGDLNSGPDLESQADRPPYLTIARAGFKPARTTKPQCCLNDDLETGDWDHIVDWVLTRPKVKLVRSFITGSETTANGRHPSDHGGVVSVLRMKR